MNVHLVDGTFELFRAYYGSPSSVDQRGKEVGAARGLARSMLALLGERDVTHVAIAFDHVIESFRNDLYPGYKTGEGMDPAPVRTVRSGRGRVPRARDRDLADGGVRVRRRARDGRGALRRFERRRACRRVLARQGSRAMRAGRARRVPRSHAAQDARRARRHREIRRAAFVDARTGSRSSATAPTAIPAFRAGARSPRRTVLAVYEHLEAIPGDAARLERRRARRGRARARAWPRTAPRRVLFRQLATLRTDVPLAESLDDLRWRGPDVAALAALAGSLGRRHHRGARQARRGALARRVAQHRHELGRPIEHHVVAAIDGERLPTSAAWQFRETAGTASARNPWPRCACTSSAGNALRSRTGC